MRTLMLGLMLLALGGCAGSTDTWKDSDRFNEADNPVSEKVDPERLYQPAQADFYRKAYEHGVRETMNEYKSRMRAREQYVFEPPVVQDVWMPARVIGGTFQPGHSEPVIIKPGRWVQENGVPAPEPKQSATTPRE